MTGNGPSPSGRRRSISSGLPGLAYSIPSMVEKEAAFAAVARTAANRKRSRFTVSVVRGAMPWKRVGVGQTIPRRDRGPADGDGDVDRADRVGRDGDEHRDGVDDLHVRGR